MRLLSYPMPKPNRRREEYFNVLTHGTGALLSTVAATALIWFAAVHGKAMDIIAASIFALTLILLYAASTIYHALSSLKWKRIFQRIDHLCIYLLIAGTYTPVALIGLKGAWGWTLFGLAWGLAIVGFIFKFSRLRRSDKLSLSLYAIMGWIAVIAIKPLIETLNPNALWMILAGGLCYTFGIYFYAMDTKKRYYHAIWHVFVLLGSAFHYFGILWFVLPQPV